MIHRRVLEMTPLLFSLTDGEVGIFSGYLKEKTLEDGEVLFREGDEGNFLCIIAEGSIGIAKKAEDDELRIMWELHANKVFGELALFDGQPRSAAALGIGKTEVYILEKSIFSSLCSKHPAMGLKLAINVVKVLCSNLRTTTARFYKTADALGEN